MPQLLQNNSGWPRRCIRIVGFMLSGVILWNCWENQFFYNCQWRFLIVGLQTLNFQNLFQMPQLLQNNSGWPRSWKVTSWFHVIWCNSVNFLRKPIFLECQWRFSIVGLQTRAGQNLFQMPQLLQNNSGWPRRCIWIVGFMLSGVILWNSWENQFFYNCQWRFLIVGLQTQNFQNLFQMQQLLQNNSGWPRRFSLVGFMLSGVILWISWENQFF